MDNFYPTMRSAHHPFRIAVSAYTMIILIGTSTCLKKLGVTVPMIADLRYPANLTCSYNIEMDAIYSIKWYKDDREFYRFMPNHEPSVMKFPLHGALVKQSNDAAAECAKFQCSIVLENLSPVASGAYTCEISTEGPAFRTYIESANMTVAAMPLEKPELEGLRGAYTLGETLDVKCKTSPSLPPATINLYINNVEVDERNVSRVIMPDNELFVSSARIQIILSKIHFAGGVILEVKCLSSLMAVPGTNRTVTRIATLGDSQPLHNQKLEWPNTAGKNKSSVSLLFIILCLKCSSLLGWVDFHPT